MSEEKKSAFKVVDRRRFTDEGDQRSGPDVPTSDPVRKDPPPPAPKPAPVAATSEDGAPVPAAKEAPPVPGSGLTLSMFLQSLAQQGLMQMGLIPWPHGQRELALDQARDTVEILELLKAKTKGNLNQDEADLLDNVLYDLRIKFLDACK